MNSKKQIRVLMAIDAFLPDIDGVINCMDNYCRCCNGLVDLTALAPRNGKFDDSKLPYKIFRCKSIRIPFLKYSYGIPKFDSKLKKMLKTNDFDIIHFHSVFGMTDYVLKYGKKYNIPVVSTFHTNFRPIFKRIFKSDKVAESCVKTIGKKYNRCDEIFTCSPMVGDQAKSFGYKGNITYLPFGTELEKPDDLKSLCAQAETTFNIQPDELVFLYVGRVMALKRITFTLDSLKILKDQGVKFRFFVVGKGMDLEKTIQYAKKIGLEEEVTFTGFLERELMPAIYARSNLFLFPSLYDNFGLVKVEAACYNTPGVFIESSCAGYGITHGVNGFLSPDNVNDFALTIFNAIADRALLKEIGENAGRDLYLNWQDATNLLVENYKAVIANHKR